MKRRGFINGIGATTALGVLPISLVKLAFGDSDPNRDQADVTFAYISDSHIQHIKGNEFVRNWDQGLKRAVAEANLLLPKPDFAVYGGDLAQLGTKPELDHGAEILSDLRYDIHHVMGEHDYYLDLGEYWRELFGPEWYSFDVKGVHFIVLNSVLTYQDWINRWETPERRMAEMALLDNPDGSPFLVGDPQRQWLADDLKKVSPQTPVVVFSHSPLQKIFKNWNFWTDDAEQIQALFQGFEQVNVIYGHVHQIQYNQIGNITFHSVMATAWPWPYPRTYSQEEAHVPILTVPMNRADPFHERDGTGWQFVGVHSGRVKTTYQLQDNNRTRTLAFDHKEAVPADTYYQKPANRIAAQEHY